MMNGRFGIFETVRVERGKTVLVDYHYKRMRRSSNFLEIPFSLSLKEFKEEIEARANFEVSLVRFSLYKDGRYKISSRPCEKKESVVLVPVSSIRRYYSPLSIHKTIDIMDSLYAFEEAKKKGGDEALLLDTNGFISETAFANIFFVKENVIFTPSLQTGCLCGTRREFILELLKEMRVPVFEGFYTLKNLYTADEVFITSARYDAALVKQIGKRETKQMEGKSWSERISNAIHSKV